ncbi:MULTISPECIES: hypothetical protein [unclassified Shewanella]|uniref:hypothetical protein n=1 Tax=unclassified Shewanella TaxID=196818 RepID=UPI00156A4968|nr:MULTISPECIES: hypothetical protein [unclassified Shewanella]MBW3514958.1 hypothetical protein [Shewanella sp. NKUCC01_JLK]
MKTILGSWPLLVSFLILVGCESEPTFETMKKNFEVNRIAFNELQKIACELGNVKQDFSYTDERYSYNPSRIDDKFRNKDLDRLLSIIGGQAIVYEKNSSKECSLAVPYFFTGNVGAGKTYGYSFQRNGFVLFDEKLHTVENTLKVGMDLKYDRPIEDGWNFSFTQF